MRKLLAGLLSIALVTAVGCGGGDDANDCGDIGRKVAACSDEPAEEIEAECQAIFDAVECEGSKQDALDCVMGLTCEELEVGPESCLEAEGCTSPTPM